MMNHLYTKSTMRAAMRATRDALADIARENETLRRKALRADKSVDEAARTADLMAEEAEWSAFLVEAAPAPWATL